jgi:hypothetical protein
VLSLCAAATVTGLPRLDASEARALLADFLPGRSGTSVPPSLESLISQEVAAATFGATGTVAVAVYDAASDQSWSSSGTRFETASIVKLAILEALLARAQSQHRGLTTVEQTLTDQMIGTSNNEAATALFEKIGGPAGLRSFLNKIGATQTTVASSWGLTRTTAWDQLAALKAFAYPNHVLTDASRQAVDRALGRVVADQRWGVSEGPEQAVVRVKNGWLSDSTGWHTNSIGHVVGNGRDYVIAVLGKGFGTERAGIDVIERTSRAVWRSIPSHLTD